MKAQLVAVIILLLVALASGGAAQVKSEAKAAPAEVVSFEWKYQGYASGETVRDESTTLSMKSKRAVVYVFKYTAKATLKNLSTKTIKAVEWSFVFVDPDSEKELKRYRIQSKQQIPPNETQTLAKDIFLDLKEDTRHLKIGKQKILLARIEYTDGSAWKP
ncbi:MAG TPA: hypothetical protein VGO69_06325 [Pyrinomonadaceae bacterium]|jgi:hypothetical protein|nr:hypothetical protein [Pyrinomonadaceae bacterium]